MAPIEPLRPLDAAGPSTVGRLRGVGARSTHPPFVAETLAPHISSAPSAALRQIILPLPEAAALMPIDAAWRADTSRAIDLSCDDLQSVVRNAAQDALRDAADADGVSPARLTTTIEILPLEARPSRNTPASHSHIRTSLLGRDGAGEMTTLDLHIARIAESGWEAALFDRAGAANGGFPYREPPLHVASLQLDGRLACFVLPDRHRMLQLTMPGGAFGRPASLGAGLSRVAIWLVAASTVAALVGVALLRVAA